MKYEYEMEELVPIVSRLAEKYTAFESTSIPYEKAEQLMKAVLYCIHETELFEHDSIVLAESLSAQKAYEIGLSYVDKKVKSALSLYHEILPEFISYENRCLYDTFIKGLPEFFKWYDIKFDPQNTILTLDYPILKDLCNYTGIDKIYEFLICINLEQKFLKKFPESYVIDILSKYNNSYKDMIDNICEIVFTVVIGHILAEKSLSEQNFKETDYIKIHKKLLNSNLFHIKNQLKSAAETFLQEYYGNDNKLLEYLVISIDSIVVRLKNAADNGILYQIV